MSAADSSTIVVVQRFVFDFIPKAHEMERRAFDARGLDHLDAWHLLQVAVDPVYQGKGEWSPTRTARRPAFFVVRDIFSCSRVFLFCLTVDDGLGYGALLLRDGFQYASGKPIYLESTTPRSRDIYAHLGFEVRHSRSSTPGVKFRVLSSKSGGCI